MRYYQKAVLNTKVDNIIKYNDSQINISDKEKRHGLGGSFDYTNTSAGL